MTPDPCELIATAQAAAITAAELSLRVAAEVPADPDAWLVAEIAGVRLAFVPTSETETKIGRGGEALFTYTTSLIVSCLLTATLTRQRLAGFVREVRDALRPQKMAGFTYMTAEIATKFDPARLHSNHFVSVVRFNYVGTR